MNKLKLISLFSGIGAFEKALKNIGVDIVKFLNQGLTIRKLTPKECWRLMGFDDNDIDICIDNGISNTQLYKQAGNSIVVPVLESIFENLLK